MPSTLCRASHLWSFWRLTPKRSASSVIVYRPLRYNSMKRVRSFTGPVTSQGITRPPFRGTSVTHVPGLFCHLCARSVPSQKLSRPGAGPPAEPANQHTRITASRRVQIASRGPAPPRGHPPRRVGFGTWALAVQLRLKPLGVPMHEHLQQRNSAKQKARTVIITRHHDRSAPVEIVTRQHHTSVDVTSISELWSRRSCSG